VKQKLGWLALSGILVGIVPLEITAGQKRLHWWESELQKKTENSTGKI